MNINFERAAAADAETLVNVQIRAFHDDARLYPGVELGGPPGYDSVETALQRIQEDDYYKIVCDGQIIGGIIVFSRGQGHFHLDLLYIDPEYHSLGIGTHAIHFIEQRYPATKWTVDTPTYSIRNQHFYEKFGYVKVSETQYDDITLIGYEKQVG